MAFTISAQQVVVKAPAAATRRSQATVVAAAPLKARAPAAAAAPRAAARACAARRRTGRRWVQRRGACARRDPRPAARAGGG
jgi:hypothetical protein